MSDVPALSQLASLFDGFYYLNAVKRKAPKDQKEFPCAK